MHLAYQCCCCYSSFLFVCFVGLYAGHPYIQLISFEIFLLSCNMLYSSEVKLCLKHWLQLIEPMQVSMMIIKCSLLVSILPHSLDALIFNSIEKHFCHGESSCEDAVMSIGDTLIHYSMQVCQLSNRVHPTLSYNKL